MSHVNEKKLSYLEFINRENSIRHHRYDEEMRQYDYLQAGDTRAIAESVHMLSSGLAGHLSDDPLRNMKYLFVASITIATRRAIEGGMEEEDAYNASDLFIQEMDQCASIQAVKELHREMFTFFTLHMAALAKKYVYAKPVIQCMDYIYYHLHTKLTLQKIADEIGLHPHYLSTLFHQETGMTLRDYIKQRRMLAAQNILRYSDYSYAAVADSLGYSSQSHFIRVFKAETGYTPREYRQKFYRTEEARRPAQREKARGAAAT